MKKSPLGFLAAALLVIGCAVEQPRFRPHQVDFREASASGQVKEFLSAMEAQASEAEKRTNWHEASDSYGWAASAANASGQLQKALTYANKSLETAEKARNPRLQASAILRLAAVYRQTGQDAKVRDLLQKGIEIAKNIPAFGATRESFQASFYEQLGRDLLRQGETDKAIEYLSYAVQMREATLAYARKIPREFARDPDGRPYP